MEILSERELEWLRFSGFVLKHIKEYTIPQYGDKPDDEIENWTPEMCGMAISKYGKRVGKNQRPGNELLDMLKAAHVACVAHAKIEEKME